MGIEGTDLREDLQRTLDTFLDEQADRLAPLGPDASVLIDQARAAVGGGKRLRASFCWWAHRGLAPAEEGEDTAPLLRACAALEVLHASALVHDDLMDASDTRRGQPSTHRLFAGRHATEGWRGDPEQYGAAAAVLVGDLLLSWSDELVRRSGFGWDRVGPALEVLDRCRSEVIAGQFLDVSVQARGRADVETAMTVLRYKSAKYSVERPLHLGAALAGADDAALSALSAYGLPLGEAFQLRDDVLGVFGDPAVTGKPAGDDLVEGKRTVLVALALDAAEPDAARLLDQSLGLPLEESAVARLREIITDSGAAAQIEEVISRLTELALEGLDRAELDPTARTALTALAQAATQRTV